jgi:hypothetical protein
MLILTNAEQGEEGKQLALNPKFVEAIYVSFSGDAGQGENCRVKCGGKEWIVQETFDQIGKMPAWSKI